MRAIFVAIITGLFIVLLAHGNLFYTWNLKLTDSLYGAKTPLEEIVIIAIDDKSLQEIGRWPWERTMYLPIISATNKSKAVAFDIAFFEPTPADKLVETAMNENGNVIIAKEYDFTRNTTLTPTINTEVGMINVYTEQDGTTRAIPSQVNGTQSLAVQTATKYLGKTPTTPETILVNFAGAPNTYKTIPAADVINGKVKTEEFENKIVLIGATSPDLHDDYIVPTSNGKRMPGVEIHAHAIQTILTKQYLERQGKISLILAILALAITVGLLATYLNLTQSGLILLALLLGYVIIGIKLFDKGIILNLVYPPITLLLTSLTTVAYKATSEAWHKKKVLRLFGKYVSKDIVDHLLKNEKAADLGGEEREITAMFADIRGFTAMSEKMTPHEVISVLNHYFGDMTDLIFKHKGTLDKYIGDCLFAVWGSPLPDKEHAKKAIECAIEIQQKLAEKHNGEFPPIALGIGICSGPAVIGNMGSPQRQEFTAIGDTINTASRLSGYAEKGEIKITETTYQLIKEHFKCKKLEPLKVKGKEKPLTIYLVTGQK